MLSPTICQLPFTQQMIESNGEIKTCCAIMPTYGANLDQNNTPYNVMTHTLSDAWNSDFMRQLRMDLIDGKEPNCCQNCWKLESKDHTQGTSVRFANASKFPVSKWQDRVEFAKNNNGYLEQKAFDFQLATGNLCNLACKMCTPRYSTAYSKFFKKFGITESIDTTFQKDNFVERSMPLDTDYKWPVDNPLVKIFENNIDEIELIFLTGGEPTLIEENLVFLEHLIEIGACNHIRIHINTNCTNINQRLLNIMQEFKEIWINLSVDGINEIAYLQRTPSNWQQIEKNLDKLMQWSTDIKINLNKKVHMSFISTITELNLHHIVDAWYYLAQKYIGLSASCNIIAHEILGVNKVPTAVSKKIYEHLLEMEDKFPENYKGPVSQLKYWLEQDIYSPTYEKIHYTLSELQRFHPDRNIKEIYNIYYD